jgi:transcriptional regulator with XRE-family HTH domain
MDSDLEVERESGYAIKVGARLRSIRRQKHLSLQDVEAASEHEFKASVLGAYERGERAISVPRLQRLARFYRVPVDQMLPSDEELGGRSNNDDDEQIVDLRSLRAVRRDDRPVTIDLGAAWRLQRPDAHHPPRGPARGCLHPRLPSRASAGPARQPGPLPGPLITAISGRSRARPRR